MSQPKRKLLTTTAFVLIGASLLFLLTFGLALDAFPRRLCAAGSVVALGASYALWHMSIGEPKHRIFIEGLSVMAVMAAFVYWRW